MKKLRFIFPLLLVSLPLSGCDFISIQDKPEEETVIIDKFYKDFDLEETGSALELNIQKFMFEKHTEWIQYGQIWGYYDKTDDRNSIEAVSDGSSLDQYFYTDKQSARVPKTSSREHVWDCSSSNGLWTHDETAGQYYVDNSYYVGGGSDLYHIRLANTYVNTARGSGAFVDFDDSEYASYKSDVVTFGESGGPYKLKLYGAELKNGKYEYAQRVEVDDAFKGDVARIILYVWTHYHDRGYYPEGEVVNKGGTYLKRRFIGSLPLSAVLGYQDLDRAKEKLMEWNRLDPPSTVEKLRNNTIQKIQGNRNIFVDYPNLVDQLFE